MEENEASSVEIKGSYIECVLILVVGYGWKQNELFSAWRIRVCFCEITKNREFLVVFISYFFPGKRNRRKKKIIEEEKSEVPNVTVASDGSLSFTIF